MKTKFISREKNDAKFSLEFTAEEFENAQIKAYQKTKDKFEVDGFRKGKAPRSIIERKYGEGIFFEDAIDELFAENYAKAVDELGLDVVDTPRAEFGKIAKGEGLTVTLTVAVAPEVEVKDYKRVEVQKIDVKVTAEQVNQELAALQKRNARKVPVEGAAKLGDTVLLDYSGSVDGVKFDGGTAEKQNLTLGSGMFIPGFEDQLVGVKPGESKEVKVTFPEEYHAEELAGKEAVFECLVHEIKEEILPELDDDFAQEVSEFDTLDELKKDTKKKLTENAKFTAENQMKDAAVEAVYEKNKEFEVPSAMVDSELDRMAQEMDQQLRYQGMTLEQYLGFLQLDMNGFMTQMRPDAEKSVKTRAILAGIAKAEKMEVTDADIDAEVENMAKAYQMEAKQIKEMLGDLSYLKKDMLVRKAADFVYDNAKFVEAPKAEKKAAEKKPAAKKETAEKKPAAKKTAEKKEPAAKKPAAKKTTK